MQPLWDLFKQFSSLRVMYAAAEQMGLTDAKPPRPVLPLTDAAQEKVAKVLKELKLS
jgi:4-hydroxy-tetrahydrodipicolinate synthase